MFYSSMSYHVATTYTNRKAHAEFERLYHQGLRCQLWSHLTGRGRSLLNLGEVQKQITVHTRYPAGVRLVPIDRILGSENRCGDFDADFRPLKDHSRERWASIALARQLDITLPVVEVVQINDRYFVRDGHHRISVARAQGQREIEAEVTVWECHPANEAISTQARVSPELTMRRRQPNLGQRLLRSLGEELVAVGNKLQALCSSEPNLSAVQGS